MATGGTTTQKRVRLSPREEEQLVARACEGDREASAALVVAHTGIIRRVARRFSGRSHSREDLFQEGVLGLLTAIRHFDPGRGHRLSTYSAYWVYQAISRAVSHQDRLIRLPDHALAELRQLAQARSLLAAQHGPEPSPRLLAAAAGLPERKVGLLLLASQEARSLDERVAGEGDACLADLVLDPAAPDPQQEACAGEASLQLRKAVAALPATERRVITGRFGLDGGPVRTLEELGGEFGVSRERIRQIEQRALRRLRQLAGDLA